MSDSMTEGEARNVDDLSPGNQLYKIGTRLLAALNIGVGFRVGTKNYVDGDNGDDDKYDGLSWEKPKKTIQASINAADAGEYIFVKNRKVAAGGTDPVSYAENLIIPATKPGLSIIGIASGRTQGGVPQIRKGSGSSPLLTIRAPGCLIEGLGFNGAGSTGGGILLDDDASSKSAFGTIIKGNHFKNCKGATATDARAGGAIMWSANGGAWQTLIQGNRFYKNVGDIVLLGTGGSIPQDVVIEGNILSGLEADVDCNIYLAAGSGMSGVIIIGNDFPAFPAIGSGSVLRFMDLTNCVSGIVAGNRFADTTTATGYGAAKTKAKIPTTVFMIKNYNESGLITRES